MHSLCLPCRSMGTDSVFRLGHMSMIALSACLNAAAGSVTTFNEPADRMQSEPEPNTRQNKGICAAPMRTPKKKKHTHKRARYRCLPLVPLLPTDRYCSGDQKRISAALNCSLFSPICIKKKSIAGTLREHVSVFLLLLFFFFFHSLPPPTIYDGLYITPLE